MTFFRLGIACVGLIAALVGACGGPTTPTSAPTSAATAVGPPPSSSSASSPGVSAPVVSSVPGLSIAADPELFDFVGDDGAGLTFRYDSETTAQVAADPDLAQTASGLAVGLYTVSGQQPADDFAVVSVVRFRNPAVDDELFRDYRDSYDEAACAQAGGVARHAESPMGANLVFIAACAGGAFTYHVLLSPPGVVVSITSVGPGRLGERLAASVGT